jgi:hypothetical protein
MNMVLKKYLFICFFLSLKIIGNCQTESGLKLITHAEDFKLQERVLLIPDQDFYLAGESINFSALTFDAALQMPIEFSSIVYVELFNQDNNVISAKKILLKQGECVNDLALPRKLETGYYYIRAYTNYMKNFGPGMFFYKKIKVVNPFYGIKYHDNADVVHDKMKLDISAESGKIVYDVENKIAFHLANLNDSIHVLLYKNDSVVAKANNKNGFGVFDFTPTINNKYRVEATSFKKGKAVVELKDIVQSGVICKLDSVNKGNAFLKVITKNYDKFPISVFVENNTVLYECSNTISKPEALLKIELPAGLNKIILKNSNQEEVSERLIYIKPKTKLEITANLDKPKALQGDSVILHINTNVNDSIHYVVALNLGNQNTSPALNELMESTLYNSSIALFTGDVSFNDLQYSSRNSGSVNDYILKFQNTGASNGKLKNINYLPEISHDIVSGNVRKISDQSLAVNKNVYLSFIDSICWINRCKTDNSGKFVAALPIDYPGNSLVVTVNDTTDNYILKLDDEFYPDFLKVVKEPYYPDSSLKDIIESRMLNLQVNDAYAELHKNTKPSRPALRFYGYPDSDNKFKKYLVPNLEEFISEIVRKATIVKKGKRVEIKVFKKEEKNSIIGDNPLVIFDGIPLFNTNNITSIPADKLESIRIVASRFFFGSEAFDGIIDITSNTKSFDLVDLDKNSTRFMFSPVRTAKDNCQQQNSRIPSYLSNIYFDKIDSASGNENIVIRLPQNTGNYSLSVFGYAKAGECGSLSESSILTISH